VLAWLRRLFLALLWVLYSLAIGWAIALIRLIQDQQRRHDRQKDLRGAGHVYTRCQVIPPDVYKRPDPLIYSQSYLMSLGLGVTWDNPDIALFDVAAGFTPVPSNSLVADTEYEIRATIYNGSTEAPAVGMPVDFSYLSFGIGTTSTFIGRTTVDLPVKGAVGHPATATMRWRTPPTPGHYCIQVNLVWGDDANPANNLGQENTDVGAAHSPAVFEFPVRNVNDVSETLHLTADSYRLPEPLSCQEVEDLERKTADRRRGGAARPRRRSRRRSGRPVQGAPPPARAGPPRAPAGMGRADRARRARPGAWCVGDSDRDGRAAGGLRRDRGDQRRRP
jgi:hypothetical protein